MKILFITTPPNNVLTTLQKLNTVEVCVVECHHSLMSLGNEIVEAVHSFAPDIILTYRCPYILPYEIFSQPLVGAYNIHPSLLPKHRGLNPWHDIMNDDSQINGVTLHKICEHIDDGEIILQQSYSITGMNYETARQTADIIAGRIVFDFINTIILNFSNQSPSI